MDGTEETAGRSSVEGKSSTATKDPSTTTQTYTQEQVEKLVNERHSKLDKTIAQLTKERDSFKASHDSLSAQFADLQRRIDEVDEAKYKDDPDQLDIFQRRKKLLAEQAALKAERDALAKEKQDNAERLAKAAEVEWDGTVLEIATAAKGDAAKLKEKAAQYGITDAGKLRGLASDLWPAGITPDSGQTSGGSTGLPADASSRDRIAKGLKDWK